MFVDEGVGILILMIISALMLELCMGNAIKISILKMYPYNLANLKPILNIHP